MKTFLPEVRKLASMGSYGYCQCSQGCTEIATEFHHMMPNTKTNNILYPLFLHSLFNCCHIAHGCHMNKPKRKIREADAAAYEIYLNQITKENK